MTRPQPLAGIRVLDFSWVWSGPLVASMLSEFGAEVIKVEHGQRLDNSRLRGRPKKDGQPVEGPAIELPPYFHQVNHGKRGITVNAKLEEGRRLLHELVAISDVLVENLSPGALERTGMGYEACSRINPRLVYLSMSAVGQDGPLRQLRAYAPVMSSLCGLEALVGYPGEEPQGMMNFGYGDPNAAVHALLALLAALYERDETGRGRHIDFSQVEALLSVLAEPLLDAGMEGRNPLPTGNRHRTMAPHGIFPAAGIDRWVSIAVADDAQWQALVACMGRPAWACAPALQVAEGRLQQVGSIERELARWTRGLDAGDLVARLRSAGIACTAVQDVAGQWDDPHFESRGLRCEVRHPITGAERLYHAPWRMELDPPRIDASAPLLGADNDYVFGQLLGIAPGRLEQLKSAGVLA